MINYKYPTCTKTTSHINKEITEVCIEPLCNNKLEPVCSVCIANNHR